MEKANENSCEPKGVPDNITAKAIALTLGYALLWFLGPVIFDDATVMVAGLPMWFWFSCIVAPVSFVFASYIYFFRR
ncbi:MAG: hypothetical protein OCC45_02240 [Desulfotalea sp.]